jgi:uncharacterized protein YhfF
VSETSSWLPPDFVHPRRVPLRSGLHLRPIRASDVEIDMPAVMGSQARLWAQYGQEWGWPPPTMTAAQDYEDLHRHEQEILAHESFNYALLNADETELLGCVYLDPLENGEDEHGAEISWWVVDALVDSAAEVELTALVPAWVAERWPFSTARFPFNRCVTTAETLREVHEGVYDEVRTPLPELDREAAEALWQDYCAASGTPSESEHPATAFGDSVELADALVGLVERGVKTATATLVSELDAEGQALPQVGGHFLACDGAGSPRLVLRTTELWRDRLDSVTEEFAWHEGEEDRSRQGWLRGHLAFFGRERAARGGQLTPADEVLFERFQVVWPPAAVERAAAFAQSVAASPAGTVS